MKKIIAALLATLVLLTALPIGMVASAETYGYFTYEVIEGTVTIVACDPEATGVVDIPDMIAGYPVTAIGNHAFYDCYAITEILIPSGVTSIGDYALAYCEGLSTLVIPAGVVSIGTCAFERCSSLVEFAVAEENPDYTAVDGVLFTKSIATLVQYPIGRNGAYVIPDSVTRIAAGAFEGCRGLTQITIPDSVTAIEEYAFGWCNQLTDLYYTGNAQEWACITIGIGNDALLRATRHCTGCAHEYAYDCDQACALCGKIRPANHAYTNLLDTTCNVCERERTVLYIAEGEITQATITTGGRGVPFVFVPAVSGIYTFASLGNQDTFGLITDADENMLAYDNDGNGMGFVITYAMTANVPYVLWAEYYDDHQTGSFDVQVTRLLCEGGLLYEIADASVTIIGYDDTLPAALEIPSTIEGLPVTAIAACAFEYCPELVSVTIPATVTTIGECAFVNCTALTTVVIPESVTTIAYALFGGCANLTTVTIGSATTSVEAYAFAFCDSLTDVYYGGTEPMRDTIAISEENEALLHAVWHYAEMGDVNHDGMVNVADAILLQRYLNGWNVTIHAATTDMNGDGYFNNKDLVLLIRYLNGWNI